jgi:hypothetical protein
MKVITEGIWEKKITCRSCKSVFIAGVSDVEHEQQMQDDESFSNQFFITCPSCSQKLIQRDIPPKIQEKILHSTLG